jgi:methionine synthase II (cobalamin-independent)
MDNFRPDCLPVLIGSLPINDHKEAAELIFEYTPEVPLWPQLPMYKEEGMREQFMTGLPGLVTDGDRVYLDTGKKGFDEDYLAFFEEYLAVGEGASEIGSSVFALTPETGRGFEEFLRQVDEKIKNNGNTFAALKGQVTGPVTFGTSMKDQNDRSVFYNDQLREVCVKKLAMNAKWQAQEFRKRGSVPIIFIDEPSLAGFGTSAYITITKEDVTETIGEIIDAVQSEKGLSGVHVCANTQWDMLLESKIDVISFDAYSYFEKFILFPKEISRYIERGSCLAWGIVPTHSKDIIENESVETLFEKFEEQLTHAEKIGIDKQLLLEHIFIAPSCGTGSISFKAAKKVLELTRGLSDRVRQAYFS